MRSSAILAIALSCALLVACASTPQQLRGNFAKIGTNDVSTGAWTGSSVRWGGIVAGARATDSGNCLEIAMFPVDNTTGTPYANSQTSGYPGLESLFLNRSAYLSNWLLGPMPRFLACGQQPLARATYPRGAIVTVVGTVLAPHVYQVNLNGCKALYGSNVHASNEVECLISLPALNIEQIVAWKEPPSQRG
jgi:hypothetical protein